MKRKVEEEASHYTESPSSALYRRNARQASTSEATCNAALKKNVAPIRQSPGERCATCANTAVPINGAAICITLARPLNAPIAK
jgi:hypothetical protein